MSKRYSHISINIHPLLAIVLLYLAFTSLLNSCITTYDTINNRNFADQYNPADRRLHPEYTIYMASPTDIRLYFRFFPKELVFIPSESDSIPEARPSIFYRITANYKSVQIIDSLTKNFSLKGIPRSQTLGYMPLSLTNEGKYVIEVFFTDLNIQNTVSTVIEFNYSKAGNENCFMFLSQYGSPQFYPYFSVLDTFRVRTEMFPSKQMWVSYYKPDESIPNPPDILQKKLIEPQAVDTSWLVENPDTTLFSLKKEGLYFFANNTGIVGKTFACFNEHYPYTRTAEDLLRTLSYLNSKAEMSSYYSYPNLKQAVDTFWVKATQDYNKSRELIRIYYNRVQLANYYFTDFKEGWLTDRGMIYIICGAPASITKSDEGEYWVYGKGAKESTKFFFYRETHPIFGNTYILERSDIYSEMWRNAISTWRDGQVFSLNP